MKVMPKTYLTITDRDFEAEVARTFGVTGYEYAVDASLYGVHDYHVDGTVSDYDRQQIKQFCAGDVTYNTAISLLNELCRRGRIAPGDYLILISEETDNA